MQRLHERPQVEPPPQQDHDGDGDGDVDEGHGGTVVHVLVAEGAAVAGVVELDREEDVEHAVKGEPQEPRMPIDLLGMPLERGRHVLAPEGLGGVGVAAGAPPEDGEVEAQGDELIQTLGVPEERGGKSEFG